MAMDVDEFRAAVNILVQDMKNDAEDLHEVHLELQELFRHFRATGMPVPEDLLALERQLETTVEKLKHETSP
ncbi:MAG: hypothetical protein WD005_00465 [Haliea sp.]